MSLFFVKFCIEKGVRNMALAAIKYRAYPTPEQAEFFQRTFGCVRKIWNCLLADSNEYHKLNKKHHVNYESQYKSVYPYLKDVDSLALSNARLQLQTAYNRFFEKKSGFPKFKSKHKSKRSYTTNNQGNTVALLDTGVKLDTIALDIIQLVDSTKGHVRVYEKKEPTEENYKKLLRIVKGIAEDLEDILYRQNIESYRVAGHEVDVRRQKIIQTIPTDDKARDNLVAVRVADGYTEGDKILRPERIKIFKYEENSKSTTEN